MKTSPAFVTALLLTAFFQYNIALASETLAITHPWIREAPPTARVLAGYMSIKNNSESSITINGISSTAFEAAELHRTVITHGIAHMQPVRQLDIPANGRITLEPGGLHLMLFDPQQALTAGDKVTLMIHLSNGTSISVSTPVIRQNGEALSQPAR